MWIRVLFCKNWLQVFECDRYLTDYTRRILMHLEELSPSKHVSQLMIWIYQKRTKILYGMKLRLYKRLSCEHVWLVRNVCGFIDRLQYSGFSKIQWEISWCCWNKRSWYKENIGFGNGNKTFESEFYWYKKTFYFYCYTIDFFVNNFFFLQQNIKTYKVSLHLLCTHSRMLLNL